jgi:hypothetical protein
MCVPFKQRDPITRRRMVIGNLSLAAALILWNFARHGDSPANRAYHFLYGLLLGISLAVNLSVALRARRCRNSAS